MGEPSGERVGKSPVEASSCGRSIASPPVSREASLPCIGPNGAFRYVSGPPWGGFSKPRPLAVVLYCLTRNPSRRQAETALPSSLLIHEPGEGDCFPVPLSPAG